MKRTITIFTVVLLALQLTNAQTPEKDAGKFVESTNEFWEKIKTENEKYNSGDGKDFIMDFANLDLPESIEEFEYYWHNDPVAQGNSGMCWCFSTTSFYESEIYRTTGNEVKLSELYTVYWEYVEKARRYVKKLGNSLFAQGSESNAVPRIWKKYGIVPADAYTGLAEGQPFHDHSKMFNEMKSYLQDVKKRNLWNEETVINTIKAIMNYYISQPPETVYVDGKEMTPQEYFSSLKLNLDNYADILSLLEKPYNDYAVYPVPDNWWYDTSYYNVELDKFMEIIKNAVRNGYTIVIGGDVSEPGYYSYKEVAMVPSFDIPSEFIDENARQMRFGNKSTTDDHGIHLVGFKEQNGKDWYLIKDSGSGSRNGANKGYYFYHEDYVKLKMMDFMVHKDALKGIIETD